MEKLRKKIKEVSEEASYILEEVKERQREYSEKVKKIKELKRELEAVETGSAEIRVSEHAVLRYLERNKGIDFNKIKEEILTKELKDLVKHFNGTGSFPSNGMSVKVKNYIITTII